MWLFSWSNTLKNVLVQKKKPFYTHSFFSNLVRLRIQKISSDSFSCSCIDHMLASFGCLWHSKAGATSLGQSNLIPSSTKLTFSIVNMSSVKASSLSKSFYRLRHCRHVIIFRKGCCCSALSQTGKNAKPYPKKKHYPTLKTLFNEIRAARSILVKKVSIYCFCSSHTTCHFTKRCYTYNSEAILFWVRWPYPRLCQY